MKFNIGFLIHKLSRLLHPAAFRDCVIDNNAKVGSGSYCVKTVMGRYSYMGDNCVAVNAKIGSFCSIAGYCCIGGGAHPTDRFSTSPVFYEGRNVFRKNFSEMTFDAEKPVVIGNDVWIGEKVFIKDGITIGDGAIIGALSIVTHDVPPYAIVGGVPAKLIRYRFSPDVIDKHLELQWWNLPDEILKSNISLFQKEDISVNDIEDFIKNTNNIT